MSMARTQTAGSTTAMPMETGDATESVEPNRMSRPVGGASPAQAASDMTSRRTYWCCHGRRSLCAALSDAASTRYGTDGLLGGGWTAGSEYFTGLMWLVLGP